MKHLHIICLSILFYGLLGFVACTSDTPTLLSEEGDDRDILLTFRTAVAGVSTRAGEDDDANVNTLRIVIVSQGKEPEAVWTVEHNSRVSPTTPLPQMYSFKVEADSRKRIYLIANEEGLVDAGGSALDFTDGTKFIPQDGNGKAAVDDYVFGISEEHPYTASTLPMTAMYEIEVPAVKEVANSEYPLPDPLYLVRAATKFTFEFTNQSIERDITVTGIDVSQVVTDKMYLMPHVNKTEDNYWVVVETKAENVSTYTKKVLQGMDWSKWMDGEIERSKRKEDNEWLTDYEIPGGTDPQTVKFTDLKADKMPKSEAGTENHSSVKIPGAFYLPESKTEKGGSNEFHLQEYSITVQTTENEGPKEYTVKLPHLASLFRNTHVIVGATFTDKDYSIDLTVDVIPFTSVPDTAYMGLEREEFTGYIVGKDSQGNTCWYDVAENPNEPAERTPYYLGPKDNIGKFVTINDKEYLLVYTDFERTAANLVHFFEKDIEKNTLIKHLLTPEGITGYKGVMDSKNEYLAYYLNNLQQRVWLDEKLRLECYRTLNEWDRLEYSIVAYNWDGNDRDNINPKYWFDILGKRYPWSEGDTKEKRKAKLGDWVKYLE